MPSLIRFEPSLRLSLAGPVARPDLVAPTLARHLGIAPDEALRRLSAPPSTLCAALPAEAARGLGRLLAAFGVTVRMDPVEARVPAETVDLWVQPLGDETPPGLAEALGGVLGSGGCCGSLARLGGIVVEGLSALDAGRLRERLLRLGPLRVLVAPVAGARFDLMPGDAMPRPLTRALARLGMAPCRLTGAVAADIDRATRDHLLARFPDAGLAAVNRAFQRFDLLLTGARGVSPREVADFLLTRSRLPRAVLEEMRVPLRIETGLTRRDAFAFRSDYAAIGLQTEIRPVRLR